MAKPKKSSKKAAKKPAAKKVAKKPAKKPAKKKPAAMAKKPGPRADFGKPIDGFLAKQPPNLRKIVDVLRDLVMEAAPTAEASLKWGQPFFAVGGEMMVAIGAHKAHVNLILPGPAGTYEDPDGLLVGEGSTGKHAKLTSVDQIPTERVRRWLSTAAKRVGA
ncbi:MAG: DUF1801 domain-containing protein [Kofleriaceae bacterium]|nr:DUF1801 domain-containing protein [Kofleriaceae bacterium]